MANRATVATPGGSMVPTRIPVRFDQPSCWFHWDERRQLGAGTFGCVYKTECKQERHAEFAKKPGLTKGECYAVKVLQKGKLSAPKHWKNILHEIEILKSVHHSACINLHDAFQSDTEIFLVLELVQGGELFNVIIERKKLTEAEANDITRQTIKALIYLHSEKIVHRDLKPENILINRDTMNIKLIDFGFAKFFGSQEDWMQMAQGPVCIAPATPNQQTLVAGLSPGGEMPASPILTTPLGSLKYLAPEILKGLVHAGIAPRTTTREDIQKLDIFAVGVVVYVMLGGAFPFASRTKAGLALQIERGIKFPADRWSGVSDDAREFCQLLLHPDRKQRPLALDCLNHPWLRKVEVPPTPINLDFEQLAKDNEDFKALVNQTREDEKAIDKAEGQAVISKTQLEAAMKYIHDNAAANAVPVAGAQQINKTKPKVKLALPKKKPSAKSSAQSTTTTAAPAPTSQPTPTSPSGNAEVNITVSAGSNSSSEVKSEPSSTTEKQPATPDTAPPKPKPEPEDEKPPVEGATEAKVVDEGTAVPSGSQEA